MSTPNKVENAGIGPTNSPPYEGGVAEGRGGSFAPTKIFSYPINHPFEIFENLPVLEPENFDPESIQEQFTFMIPQLCLLVKMNLTIKFNGQFLR